MTGKENKEGVQVTKVVVQLGKRELTLTIEEAKQLKDTLNTLFGKEVIKEVREEHHHHHSGYYWHHPWEVLCSDGSTPRTPDGIYCGTTKGNIGAIANTNETVKSFNGSKYELKGNAIFCSIPVIPTKKEAA